MSFVTPSRRARLAAAVMVVSSVSGATAPAWADAPTPTPAPAATTATTVATTSTTVSTPTTSVATATPTPAADIESLTNGVDPKVLLARALVLLAAGEKRDAVVAPTSGGGRSAAPAPSGPAATLDADLVTASQARAAGATATVRARLAARAAMRAESAYVGLAGAVRDAALSLYTGGRPVGQASATTAQQLMVAAGYEATALGPTGVLDARRADARIARIQSATAARDAATARAAAARADAAMASAQQVTAVLGVQAAALGQSTAAVVTAEQTALAQQAGAQLTAPAALQWTPKAPLPAPLAATSSALGWMFAELGRPYVWGATGPGTFDCSGLTQFSWRQSGVTIPRVAAAQYLASVPVPLSRLLPGDLVFFGDDIHHVGMYIGDGLMVNAPHTGDVVRVSPIWWSDLIGFGRVVAAGTAVPAHKPPTVPAVVPAAGTVPSQSTPAGPNPTTPPAPSTTTTTVRGITAPSTTSTTVPTTTGPSTTGPATTVTTLPPTTSSSSSTVAP